MLVQVGHRKRKHIGEILRKFSRSGSLLWHLLQEGDGPREAAGDDRHDRHHGVRRHGCEGHLSRVWGKGWRLTLYYHSVQLSVYLQVFEAEKMTGKYGIYHQKCFKCSKCKRPLDYGSLAEGPDNQLYCKERFHWILKIYIASEFRWEDSESMYFFSNKIIWNLRWRTAMQWSTATSLNPTFMMLMWVCSR